MHSATLRGTERQLVSHSHRWKTSQSPLSSEVHTNWHERGTARFAHWGREQGANTVLPVGNWQDGYEGAWFGQPLKNCHWLAKTILLSKMELDMLPE